MEFIITRHFQLLISIQWNSDLTDCPTGTGSRNLWKNCKSKKPDKIRKSKGMRIFLSLILIVIGIWAVGALLSSPIVNAGKYQKLMAVENGEFSKDIEELSFDQIPLTDKDSAEILGNRKMGSMVDMVSQFEVDELYSQINYQDRPVRVSPLKYADLIKWFTNRKEGNRHISRLTWQHRIPSW